jgi:deazaflavin-dependent oxidoreductase (nitroreductase family)
VVRPLFGLLASRRGKRLDAWILEKTGRSPYAYLYGINAGFQSDRSNQVLLALTTIGRRTGRLHTVGLASYPVEAGWALVGSASGAPSEPHWVRNLRENPAAWITLRRRRIPVLAEVLDGERKRPLWERITATAPFFDEFQRKAQRDIPIVVLRPRI